MDYKLNSQTGKCECAPGFYLLNSSEQRCELCHSSCEKCIGKDYNECVSCPEHSIFHPDKLSI